MANHAPAYLWYPKDALSSGRISALSDLEELWYRRALDHAWLAEGLPADPSEFAGWIGRGCTVAAAEKIIAKFFEPHKKDTSKVVNPRQEEERKKFKKKIQERSKAGIESGRKRRERSKLSDEQMFNKTRTKSNNTIPNGISKDIPIKEQKTHRHKQPQTAEELLAECKSNPAYTGINIDGEFTKAVNWIADHPGREFNKRFFVNWLNKVDAPIAVNLPKAGPKIPEGHPPVTLTDMSGPEWERREVPVVVYDDTPKRPEVYD